MVDNELLKRETAIAEKSCENCICFDSCDGVSDCAAQIESHLEKIK